ncbi:MAG: helix-turn-helix domain-containing protein [Thermoplasmata archaeon]
MPIRSKVEFDTSPMRASWAVLGRKWTLPILYEVAIRGTVRFNQVLKSHPRLTGRALTKRLGELVNEGILARRLDSEGNPYYVLTDAGQDVWPILTALMNFGIRRYPQKVFADHKKRELTDVYPGQQELMLGSLTKFAQAKAPKAAPAPVRPLVAKTRASATASPVSAEPTPSSSAPSTSGSSR